MVHSGPDRKPVGRNLEVIKQLLDSCVVYLAQLRIFLRNFWQAFNAAEPSASKDYDEEILDSDRQERTFGYVVVGLVFLGFGTWASFAPIESAALGRGTVQVEGNRKPVQHLEGGIVFRVHVSNGDYVTESQLLLELDQTQLRAQQSITEGRMWAKQATVSRLESERDGLTNIFIPEGLAAQQDQRARAAIRNESALFKARLADLEGEISVLMQRERQNREQISGLQAVLKAKENVASSLEIEVGDLNQLLSEGYVDKQRIRTLERSLAQTLGEIADLKSSIASTVVAVEEAELQMVQVKKRFVTRVVDQLSKEQEELYDLTQQLRAISDRVNRAEIRAPVSGYVLAFDANSGGAVIAPAQEIMSIVPDVGRLMVSARLSPMDIDRIRIGQDAEVRFAVFKDAFTVTGTLVKVSADSLLDESTGQHYFEAEVALFAEDLNLLGDDRLVPGMPADVLIKTGNRTLLGYITSPLQRMFENSLIED